MEQAAFYVFAALAVVASLLVIGLRSPMHSVILLIVSFAALSGLYILLDAPFTAVTQIIIYAGAIMVLFLFVVMLLNAHTEDDIPVRLGPHAMKAAVLLSLLLAIELAAALTKMGRPTFSTDPGAASSI